MSRFRLTPEPRHLPPWLILGVRQKSNQTERHQKSDSENLKFGNGYQLEENEISGFDFQSPLEAPKIESNELGKTLIAYGSRWKSGN